MGGERPTARIQSAVGLEPDARNDADHAFAEMSTGIPHLRGRDEDACAVPLGALGLQVTSLLALGGYSVEWVASAGVIDLPPLVPKAPLQEGLCVVLDQLPLDGVDLPSLGLRILHLAFGAGVAEGRHGQFPFLDSVGHSSEPSGRFRSLWCVVCLGRRGWGRGCPRSPTEDSVPILLGILIARLQALAVPPS